PLAARLAASGWREPSIYGELPNAIEALVELAELGEARRLLADLQDRVSRIESPWGEASAGRCEGLILAAEGDLPGALAALERAPHRRARRRGQHEQGGGGPAGRLRPHRRVGAHPRVPQARRALSHRAGAQAPRPHLSKVHGFPGFRRGDVLPLSLHAELPRR